jgi:hypothetical protein
LLACLICPDAARLYRHCILPLRHRPWDVSGALGSLSAKGNQRTTPSPSV